MTIVPVRRPRRAIDQRRARPAARRNAALSYPSGMPLHHLVGKPEISAPTVIAALDGWVDAGSASTQAATRLADGGEVVATFDNDLIYDYRSRRPMLEIVNGRPSTLSWPELVLRHVKVGEKDVLVLTGPEPDYRWRQLSSDIVKLAKQLDVAEWISLGSIPAAVPHTRSVPVLGTASRPGLLRGDVREGPEGLLKVPAAAISVIDIAISRAGIPAIGYFAQIPHYVSGAYPAAAVELLRTVGRHLGTELTAPLLTEEGRQLQTRLDAAMAVDSDTREYVKRLETMSDESRLPSGGDLISDIERFLRERGGPSGRPN